jgi:hypothetical protein
MSRASIRVITGVQLLGQSDGCFSADPLDPRSFLDSSFAGGGEAIIVITRSAYYAGCLYDLFRGLGKYFPALMIGAYTVGLKSCSHSPLPFALLFKPRSVGFSVHFQVPYVRFFLIQGRQPRTCMASHLAGKELYQAPSPVRGTVYRYIAFSRLICLQGPCP